MKRNRHHASPRTKALSIRYYQERKWKISTRNVPCHQYPYCVTSGFRYVKIYERQDGNGNWEYVRGIAEGGR